MFLSPLPPPHYWAWFPGIWSMVPLFSGLSDGSCACRSSVSLPPRLFGGSSYCYPCGLTPHALFGRPLECTPSRLSLCDLTSHHFRSYLLLASCPLLSSLSFRVSPYGFLCNIWPQCLYFCFGIHPAPSHQAIPHAWSRDRLGCPVLGGPFACILSLYIPLVPVLFLGVARLAVVWDGLTVLF